MYTTLFARYAVPSVTVIVVAPATDAAVRTLFEAFAQLVAASSVGAPILTALMILAPSLKARDIILTRVAP